MSLFSVRYDNISKTRKIVVNAEVLEVKGQIMSAIRAAYARIHRNVWVDVYMSVLQNSLLSLLQALKTLFNGA
jgi:hypothetical protein